MPLSYSKRNKYIIIVFTYIISDATSTLELWQWSRSAAISTTLPCIDGSDLNANT